MTAALKAGRGLELRPLHLRDAKALFPLVEANRERLGRWLPWVDANHSVLDTRAFIVRVRAHARAGIGQSFGLWWKGTLVGTAGFVWIDAANHSAAIGYWLAREAEGHGLMTAAVTALLRHGFRSLKLNRIEIRAGVRNRRSRAWASATRAPSAKRSAWAAASWITPSTGCWPRSGGGARR